MKSLGIAVFDGLSWVAWMAGRLCLVALAMAVIVHFLGRFDDADRFSYLSRLIEMNQGVAEAGAAALRDTVPTTFNGRDLSRVFMGAGVLLLAILLDRVAMRLRSGAVYLRCHRNIDHLARRQQGAGGDPSLAPLNECLESMKRKKKLDRAALLEIYAETKRRLEGQARHRAFLSVDIVDSTGMKDNEEPALIERDFGQYRQLLEEILAARSAIKSTWTPDGVMICFADESAAINAGLDLLERLKTFNSATKMLRRDFDVRIGVNSGTVQDDDDVPMEKMSSHTIDVAGHLQKSGARNTVWVTAESLERVRGEFVAARLPAPVDGHDVFEISGRGAAATPPP